MSNFEKAYEEKCGEAIAFILYPLWLILLPVFSIIRATCYYIKLAWEDAE